MVAKKAELNFHPPPFKGALKMGFFTVFKVLLYRKDTEPFIPYFHVLTFITSFQYLSIHAMSFIACYSYMLSIYLIGSYTQSITHS